MHRIASINQLYLITLCRLSAIQSHDIQHLQVAGHQMCVEKLLHISFKVGEDVCAGR